jgi:hypothetical protein
MPGGNVIYLPENKTFGGEMGKGVGGALSAYAVQEMKRQEDLRHNEQTMRAINMVKKAGTREKALEIITTPGVAHFRNAMELEQARKWIDEIYPQADLTPTPVEGYDAGTGDPLKAWVPKNQLGSPEAVTKALGPNATLRKPDLVEFFAPVGEEGSMKSMGRRPRSDQSEGEFTEKEIDLQRKAEADRRAAEAADRQASAAGRSADAAKRAADKDDGSSMERTARLQQMAKSMLADVMGIEKKLGVDNIVTLNFNGDNEKQRQFMAALNDATRQVMQDKTGDINDAVTKAATKHGIGKKPEAPAPAPAAEKKEPGFIERAVDKAKIAAVTEVAPADPKTRKVGKYYDTPKGGIMKWTGTGWVK